MILHGTYSFHKGTQVVAKLSFQQGSFQRIKELIQPALLPPFIEDRDVVTQEVYTLRLKQFFRARRISNTHPYYVIAKEMEQERYLSFFDEYWLAVDDTPYEQLYSYQLSQDAFARQILWQSSLRGGYSPNLSLPYQELTLFDKQGDTRFLLQEYSKTLADQKKQQGVSYTIEIIQDIPFLRVALERGSYYFLDAVLPKGIAGPKLLRQLQAIDPSFSPDIFMKEGCFLRMDDTMKVTYL